MRPKATLARRDTHEPRFSDTVSPVQGIAGSVVLQRASRMGGQVRSTKDGLEKKKRGTYGREERGSVVLYVPVSQFNSFDSRASA